MIHTFWYGEGEESFEGLLFTYYNEDNLNRASEGYCQVVTIKRYTEASADDSLVIVCRNV